MVSGYLRVSPTELGAVATKVEEETEKYRVSYTRIQNEAQELCGEWTGPAAEAFLSRIMSFDNDFKSLNNLLLSYVDFLRAAEANYEENENDIIEVMRNLSTGR